MVPESDGDIFRRMRIVAALSGHSSAKVTAIVGFYNVSEHLGRLYENTCLGPHFWYR